MLALIGFFVELALLRRGPQDLPAATFLLVLLALLSVLIGTVNSIDLFGGVRPALGANLLDLSLVLVLLFLLLQVRGHAPRWQQTASAFLGLSVLAGLVTFAVRLPAAALGVTDIAILFDLVLAVWLHVALGNVLRHALGLPLLAGVIIVLSYTVLAFNVIARIFPPAVGG